MVSASPRNSLIQCLISGSGNSSVYCPTCAKSVGGIEMFDMFDKMRYFIKI